MVSYNKEVEKLPPRQLLPIETLLCPPGRLNRPSKIVIILRGLPGSGKSYVARLIKVCLLELSVIHLFKLINCFYYLLGKRSINGRTSSKNIIIG